VHGTVAVSDVEWRGRGILVRAEDGVRTTVRFVTRTVIVALVVFAASSSGANEGGVFGGHEVASARPGHRSASLDGARLTRSRVYFVETNGSDRQGDGSETRPWRTIPKACASTPGGVGNTINVGAGTYVAAATCTVPCRTNLRGAGPRRTTVAGVADPLVAIHDCAGHENTQLVRGLHLDGRERTAGVYGLRVIRTRGVTISDMLVEGFRGPPDAGGGAIDVEKAWDLDLGHSVLRDSGHAGRRACSGTLGLGDLYHSRVHDLTISEDRGYGVKSSTNGVAGPSHMRDVDFFNLDVRASSTRCAVWSTLAFELWETDTQNTTIRNSRFNRPVSLTDVGKGSPLQNGYRYRIHHNLFAIATDEDYALELDQNCSTIDHNYVVGGLYAIANFTRDPKRRISIHHNVFDNQVGPTTGLHLTAGVRDATFYNNTVVLRQPSLREGVFSLSELGLAGSTIRIVNNIFMNPNFWVGDKLGSGLDDAYIDHNEFYNLSAQGTAAVVGNTPLSLSGAFPSGYVPKAASPAIDAGVAIPGITSGYVGTAPDLGAFDRGAEAWSVGPTR
jgi:hypothetical protein